MCRVAHGLYRCVSVADKQQIKLLLIGGGGHCRSCIDVIRATQQYDIVGILDAVEKVGQTLDGVPIIGSDADLEAQLSNIDECLITVGQIANSELRQRLFDQVKAANIPLATVLSPNATIAETATIAEGTIVMHQALVNAEAKIEANVIVNSFALIEHDAQIGAHTHISTRATINGAATVGRNCFIGSHALVFQQCQVGRDSIVGGGQVVRADLPNNSQPNDVKNISSSQKPVFIIAEAGVNHNGDVDLAKKMIEIAAKAGVDAVKFQTFHAESLTTSYAEKADYQKQATTKIESQQEMLKALELPEKSYVELVSYCETLSIEFMSTAFDIESLDFLVELGIKRIKIPSGELTNVPLLRHCAKQNLPLILSTGMATYAEVLQAKSVLIDAGADCNELTILHCNTAYPTPFIDANLACIQTLKKLGCEVGYSDHTLGDEAVIASIALGAGIVEKHFTLDRTMDGPDQSTSLEPNELQLMVSRIRNIEKAFGNGIKEPTNSELENIPIARKSIVAGKPIKKGEIFSDINMTTKRPGNGVSAALWDQALGKIAQRDYMIDEQIEL